MQKKTINLNIRMEQHVKEKAQKLAREKGMTLTDLIVGYIVSDYAMRSLFNNEIEVIKTEGEENVKSNNSEQGQWR